MSKGSLLQNLLTRVDTTNNVRGDAPSTKYVKSEIEGQPIRSMIWYALMSQWKYVQSNPTIEKSSIEVEIRMGMLLRSNVRWHAQTSSRMAVIFDEDSRRLNGLEYDAGIDYIFMSKHLIEKILIEKNDFRIASKSVNRIRSTNSSLRWEVVNHTDHSSSSSSSSSIDQIKVFESKERFFRWNCGLLSFEYDIRLDGAVEKNQKESNNIQVDFNQDWTQERIKHRTTYVSSRFPSWKVDLTEVTVLHRNQSSSSISEPRMDYELEFELENSCAEKWFSITSEEEAGKMAYKIGDSLEGLLNFCIPSEDPIEDNMTLESIRSTEYFYEIKLMNDSLLKSMSVSILSSSLTSTSTSIEFLGSMPVNMSRANLEFVRRSDYFITEKSDGIRYLMYVIKDSVKVSENNLSSSSSSEVLVTVVFMNRSKEIFRIPGAQRMGKIFGQGTILDCELVYNKTFKSQMILIFDVLALDGTSYIKKPFRERLLILDTIINNRAAEYVKLIQSLKTSDNHVSSHSIQYVTRKKYLLKQDIGNLLSRIRFENGERVYFESDGRRHHKTDGIIFQPSDSYYVFYSDYNLLKWKWSDLRSVDLIATPHHPTISLSSTAASSILDTKATYPFITLSSSGPDGILIDCTRRGNQSSGLSKFDSYRLLADIMNPQLSYGMNTVRIVEVMYDAEIGQWKYLRFRSDKSKPNYIDTVISVFVEQAENISIEELEYTFIVSPEKPSFRNLMMDKMQRLVEEARSQMRKPIKS